MPITVTPEFDYTHSCSDVSLYPAYVTGRLFGNATFSMISTSIAMSASLIEFQSAVIDRDQLNAMAILQANPNFAFADLTDGRSALRAAIESELPDVALAILRTYRDNAYRHDEVALYKTAIVNNMPLVLIELLRQAAEPQRFTEIEDILGCLQWRGRLWPHEDFYDVMRTIKALKIDINDLPYLGTPLHFVFEGTLWQIEGFYLAGLDLNYRNSLGWSPIHTYTQNGKHLLLAELLKYGADPELKFPHDDETPLSSLGSSLGDDCFECARVLLAAGANPRATLLGDPPLIFCAVDDNTRLMRLLLDYSAPSINPAIPD
ncbi:MAG: hypothetical protein QM811_30380 [Pirellulales bacterium]